MTAPAVTTEAKPAKAKRPRSEAQQVAFKAAAEKLKAKRVAEREEKERRKASDELQKVEQKAEALKVKAAAPVPPAAAIATPNGSVDGIRKHVTALQALGKRCYFVTNNSTKTRAEYVKILASVAGIATQESCMLTSAYAAAVCLQQRGINKKVYVVGGDSLAAELQSVAGVQCLGPEDWGKVFSFGVSKPEDLDPDVQAVVIGFDPK